MVIIYYKSNESSKKALRWLDMYNVDYQIYPVEEISRKHLVKILSMTDKGIKEILKKKCTPKNQINIDKLYSMNMENMLLYLTLHSELLSTPLIFSDNNLLIGYNEDQIRKFIPRNTRIIHRSLSMLATKGKNKDYNYNNKF